MSQNLNLKIESLEAQLQKCHQTIAMKDSVIKMLKKKLSAKTSHKSRGGMRRKKKRTVKKARKKRNRKRRKTSKKSHTRRLKEVTFIMIIMVTKSRKQLGPRMSCTTTT